MYILYFSSQLIVFVVQPVICLHAFHLPPGYISLFDVYRQNSWDLISFLQKLACNVVFSQTGDFYNHFISIYMCVCDE